MLTVNCSTIPNKANAKLSRHCALCKYHQYTRFIVTSTRNSFLFFPPEDFIRREFMGCAAYTCGQFSKSYSVYKRRYSVAGQPLQWIPVRRAHRLLEGFRVLQNTLQTFRIVAGCFCVWTDKRDQTKIYLGERVCVHQILLIHSLSACHVRRQVIVKALRASWNIQWIINAY